MGLLRLLSAQQKRSGDNLMDAGPTADIADKMADTLEGYAKQIRDQSRRMRETGDLQVAAEVINSVTNCFQNLRLDLMVTRPLRECEREAAIRNSAFYPTKVKRR